MLYRKSRHDNKRQAQNNLMIWVILVYHVSVVGRALSCKKGLTMPQPFVFVYNLLILLKFVLFAFSLLSLLILVVHVATVNA